MMTPTYRSDQIAAEAADKIYREGLGCYPESMAEIILAAIEKAKGKPEPPPEVEPDEPHPPATEWIPLADGRGQCGVKDKEGWIARGLTEHQAMTISAAHNAALDDLRKELQCTQQALDAERRRVEQE